MTKQPRHKKGILRAINKREQRKKKDLFLAELRKCGRVDLSAKAIGICSTTPYDWVYEDKEFQKQFEEAREFSSTVLENEAVRRAVDGVEESFFDKDGNEITRRKYSDTLLIFLLKGLNRKRYAERHELTGKDGGPVEIQTMKIGDKIIKF